MSETWDVSNNVGSSPLAANRHFEMYLEFSSEKVTL